MFCVQFLVNKTYIVYVLFGCVSIVYILAAQYIIENRNSDACVWLLSIKQISDLQCFRWYVWFPLFVYQSFTKRIVYVACTRVLFFIHFQIIFVAVFVVIESALLCAHQTLACGVSFITKYCINENLMLFTAIFVGPGIKVFVFHIVLFHSKSPDYSTIICSMAWRERRGLLNRLWYRKRRNKNEERKQKTEQKNEKQQANKQKMQVKFSPFHTGYEFMVWMDNRK